jgi:aryl-alcohol dehydrogenase (NADP+)
MQNHYNLIYREEEREMIPYCIEEGIALIPWSPMARGFLAGNRTADKGGDTARSKSDGLAHNFYYSDADFTTADRVEETAQQVGCTPAQIALAWMLNKPHITSPIIGASKMHHLEQAIEALDITLTDEQIATLEEPYQPRPALGHQ